MHTNLIYLDLRIGCISYRAMLSSDTDEFGCNGER